MVDDNREGQASSCQWTEAVKYGCGGLDRRTEVPGRTAQWTCGVSLSTINDK